MIRIALAQYSLADDVPTNLARALESMQAAAAQGAHMVLFPELCLSPFFPQFAGRDASRYAMSIDDASIRQFQEACRRSKIWASPNVYLQEGARRFDASLMIADDGAVRGVSKMVHIAQVPNFYEQDYYTPSDTGFKVYETPHMKSGVVVCFDRHYPESIRTCVLKGAELILIPTANTLDEPRDLFECELRAAAMQNGVYIAMCNRVGKEGDVVFCGESIIVGPNGEVIIKSRDAQELVIADIDPAQVALARRKRPYLALRRPELYL